MYGVLWVWQNLCAINMFGNLSDCNSSVYTSVGNRYYWNIFIKLMVQFSPKKSATFINQWINWTRCNHLYRPLRCSDVQQQWALIHLLKKIHSFYRKPNKRKSLAKRCMLCVCVCGGEDYLNSSLCSRTFPEVLLGLLLWEVTVNDFCIYLFKCSVESRSLRFWCPI